MLCYFDLCYLFVDLQGARRSGDTLWPDTSATSAFQTSKGLTSRAPWVSCRRWGSRGGPSSAPNSPPGSRGSLVLVPGQRRATSTSKAAQQAERLRFACHEHLLRSLCPGACRPAARSDALSS